MLSRAAQPYKGSHSWVRSTSPRTWNCTTMQAQPSCPDIQPHSFLSGSFVMLRDTPCGIRSALHVPAIFLLLYDLRYDTKSSQNAKTLSCHQHGIVEVLSKT